MAQPLSRPLVLSRPGPWPPAPPPTHFPRGCQSGSGSQRMPRSGSRSQALDWTPSPPQPLLQLLTQIPVQPRSLPCFQGLSEASAQPLPLFQSLPQPLLSSPLPLYIPPCPAGPSPLAQPLPSSLCLPKSLPLPPTVSHTLPLSQPRLRSGHQLPPSLLLLLLFSVLGPGAGEWRSRKLLRQGWGSGREGWTGGVQERCVFFFQGSLRALHLL